MSFLRVGIVVGTMLNAMLEASVPEEGCRTLPVHLGKFCVDQTTRHIAHLVWGIPDYCIFLLSFFGVLALTYFLTRQLLKHSNPQGGHPAGINAAAAKFSVWMTVFMTVCFIWGRTVAHDPSTFGMFIRIALAMIVIPSICLLEGMAMAVIELEDKELPEHTGSLDTSQAKGILNGYLASDETYLRAREWFMAALIILLTLVVEFEKYYIPLVGTYEGGLARTVITVFLATVAVIWIAQAPGKGLGRKRPVTFLNFPLGPMLMNKIIFKIAAVAKWTGVDQPSDAVSNFLNGLFRETEPALAPGGPRLFAEMIRRYGFGEIFTQEQFLIEADGSGVLIQEELVYIGKGKVPAHIRHMFADVPFVQEPDILWRKAFIVPVLGASIEEDQKKWGIEEDFDPLLERDVKYEKSWLDSQKVAVITVTLPDDRLRDDQAYVLKMKTRARFEKGNFKVPGVADPHDWCNRTLSRPCYKAQTEIRLQPSIQSALFDNVTFKVTQKEQGVIYAHQQETVRFCKEQEWKATSGQPRTWNGVPEDGRSLTINLKEGLPGASYQIEWDMTYGVGATSVVYPPTPPPVINAPALPVAAES